MQAKSSAVLVLAAAIVLAALIVVLSPLLWSDHMVLDYRTPVPNGCSIQTTPNTIGGMVIVAHCPFWVKF